MTEFIDSTNIKEKKELKKTIFLKAICFDGTTKKSEIIPESFKYVELIRRKDLTYDFDLFSAYNKKEDCETWYLGIAGEEFK